MNNINGMIDEELAKDGRREPAGDREMREASEAARESGAIGKVRFDEFQRRLNAEKVAAGYPQDVQPTETPAPQLHPWEHPGVGVPLGGECNQAMPCEFRPSHAEIHEKEAGYHAEQAQKRARAAIFLRAHPEFGEFIDLIRNGTISI